MELSVSVGQSTEQRGVNGTPTMMAKPSRDSTALQSSALGLVLFLKMKWPIMRRGIYEVPRSKPDRGAERNFVAAVVQNRFALRTMGGGSRPLCDVPSEASAQRATAGTAYPVLSDVLKFIFSFLF